jgi:hypothetical protein
MGVLQLPQQGASGAANGHAAAHADVAGNAERIKGVEKAIETVNSRMICHKIIGKPGFYSGFLVCGNEVFLGIIIVVKKRPKKP